MGELGANETETELVSWPARPHLNQQSFLIPMALVQTPVDSSSSPNSNSAADEQQQQFSAADAPRQLLGLAGSQLHASQAQPLSGPAAADWAQPATTGGRRSPMQLHQQRLEAAASASASSSPVSSSLNQGFMSSFLQAEKEKMTAAALRLQQQQQQVAAAAVSSRPGQLLAASSTTSTSSSPQQQPPQQQPQPQPQQQPPPQRPGGPGGLMPVMMVPFSRMPDNAIGQAYGAAVGTALPAESGRWSA